MAIASTVPPLALFVNRGRIKHAFADDLDIARGRVDFGEEATSISFVTRRAANLFDLCQQCVGVAIVKYLLEMLHIAALFALPPQLLPAAAVVAHAAGFQRFAVCFFVHVGQHQYVAIGGILGNDGDQITLAKIGSRHSFAHEYSGEKRFNRPLIYHVRVANTSRQTAAQVGALEFTSWDSLNAGWVGGTVIRAKLSESLAESTARDLIEETLFAVEDEAENARN